MRLLLLLPAICFCCAPACRSYSRVERHFLRVPAMDAAVISSIDREKWLKQARKESSWKDRAREEHYFFLSAATRPPGLRGPEGEVRFFPVNEADQTGMVALHWLAAPGQPGSSSLSLLKVQGGRYAPQSPGKWLKTSAKYGRYSLSAEPGAIVCYNHLKSLKGPVWKKVAVLRWQHRQWAPEFPP